MISISTTTATNSSKTRTNTHIFSFCWYQLYTDLRSDSNPWRIGSSPFDTPAPIRLLESVTVPVGSGRGRPGSVQKWPKYLFLLAMAVSLGNDLWKPFSSIHCLLMITWTSCNMQEWDCTHIDAWVYIFYLMIGLMLKHYSWSRK